MGAYLDRQAGQELIALLKIALSITENIILDKEVKYNKEEVLHYNQSLSSAIDVIQERIQ